jgi:WS/DGAT/MGAT family acyltransferase
MHIGWLAVLDAPPSGAFSVRAVRERLAARLHRAPRFRQTVEDGLGGPRWIDDADFALERHVTTASSRTHSDDDLRAAADAELSRPLDRDRPLWALHVIPRVAGGRCAIVGRVHHAMVDGLAAVQLGMLLFDAEPEPPPPEPPPDWRPRSPSTVRKVAETAADTAIDQFRAARSLASLGRSPGRGVRVADGVRRAALGLADDLAHPAPPSYLNRPIGPQRTLVSARLELDELNAARRRAGASVNDAVLAVVAGALGRLARAEAVPPEDVRAMVPASVRSEPGAADGNRIAFVFVDLPVAERCPRERLGRIATRMRELKSGGRVAGSGALLGMLGGLPAPLQSQAARFAASPRLYNLTVSCLPGPPVPLWVAGARVREIEPLIPIPDKHGLAVGALSYDGGLSVTAYADPEALPGISGFGDMAAEAAEELEHALV